MSIDWFPLWPSQRGGHFHPLALGGRRDAMHGMMTIANRLELKSYCVKQDFSVV
jgi:hypothetical protein